MGGELSEGVLAFYATQADLMLSQCENIERLLGKTRDYTAPGTYCETLLRDFLQRYLLRGHVANKGFMFGRRDVGGETKHCPEIDILIHDNFLFRPILQIDDFVIVKPNAARGAIQVKRHLNAEELRSGIRNVLDASLHYEACKEYPLPPPGFCSAIVFFRERSERQDGRPPETYENTIRELLAEPEVWDHAPLFIGSLHGHFWLSANFNINSLHYNCWKSDHGGGKNIALQVLLRQLITRMFHSHTSMELSLPDIFGGDPLDRIELTK